MIPYLVQIAKSATGIRADFDFGDGESIGIERIDRLLFFLAELINYDDAAMKDIKHCIELRQACAALAFRLFDWKTVNCGKGVEKWREICKSSDEANEVRNQWIW